MTAIHLNAIRLNGIVAEDRTLTVQLPPEVPDGPVELLVLLPEKPESSATASSDQSLPERDRLLTELRDRVNRAGAEGAVRFPDPHAQPAPLSDAELLELGKLPPNARPSHELINEDREERI